MRTFLLLLIGVLINGWVTDASGEDLFLGRVLSVDRDAGRLSVLLIEEGPDGMEGEVNAGEPVEVAIHPDRLPRSLSSGSMVRIWGDLREGDGVLSAARLQASGHGAGGKDATGVRRRIGKSRGQYGGKGGGKGHGRQ
ncbi:MAG: hypothetical protein QG552_3782 [Thermodesulfobacteriota bacterium]|nr:hypothetical protein [Thermodesulfobacteriota bacterium]